MLVSAMFCTLLGGFENHRTVRAFISFVVFAVVLAQIEGIFRIEVALGTLVHALGQSPEVWLEVRVEEPVVGRGLETSKDHVPTPDAEPELHRA